jgi:hypothetical protein
VLTALEGPAGLEEFGEGFGGKVIDLNAKEETVEESAEGIVVGDQVGGREERE